ncbi:hypothetical protein AVEN_23942-1 [Araneus ventricosus]|uniref:Uncharacterized protein n=1 Tax=Araneus ventricosus TaxID=182803 RepID=A0A4Y2NH58_ARAVE|nr:hypothetical protein AVEN_23942-1 [Araneus ventricosus]
MRLWIPDCNQSVILRPRNSSSKKSSLAVLDHIFDNFHQRNSGVGPLILIVNITITSLEKTRGCVHTGFSRALILSILIVFRVEAERRHFPKQLTCGKSDVSQPNRGYQNKPVNYSPAAPSAACRVGFSH